MWLLQWNEQLCVESKATHFELSCDIRAVPRQAKLGASLETSPPARFSRLGGGSLLKTFSPVCPSTLPLVWKCGCEIYLIPSCAYTDPGQKRLTDCVWQMCWQRFSTSLPTLGACDHPFALHCRDWHASPSHVV
mmetsp:Transcript_6417/g.15685  ORF Transcript_6417/g.15685 Transcript_6417/m.15685 type:complete len:134 (-) Transcript_6417:13-414(-)